MSEIVRSHGFTSSASTVEVAIRLPHSKREKVVKVAVVDKLFVLEGDILVSERTPQEGVAIVGQEFRWPNKTVPFVIDPNLPDQSRVTNAIRHWEEHTELRFPRRTEKDKNFLFFTDLGGCFSAVGMQGGEQPLSLGPNCTTGNAIHEIGHAIGLWHEQSREDRGDFVKILTQNVMPGFEHNFDQHITDGDDIGPYDYASIMHYPATAFGKNGAVTIVPVDDKAQIGQRDGLSAGDIAAVKALYP